MNDKMTEVFRKILMKTIIPLQIKWERYVSQFHFSIAFRIAFNYVRLFVLYGVFFFAMIIAVYLRVETNEYKKYSKERVEAFIAGKDEFENPNYNNGMSMRVVNHTDQRVEYNDILMDVYDDHEFLNRYSYNYQGNQMLILKDSTYYEKDGKEYEAYFQYDISRSLARMKQFIGTLLIIYIIFVVFVAKFGKTGIERLFKPIEEMSTVANKLTVANLHSQRLNVAGTKNELKELAGTINNMLDRIELSYESQKQFVSDASHELRTPIAVIQGYANMLDRWGSKNEEVLEESIEAIINESKSMQDLVEKLLFLSRHDKKTLKLIKSRFNMRDVVEEMMKETKLVVKDRVVIAPVLKDVYVYGDQQALKQAIRIFVENAVKYSKEGDTISISCDNDHETCVVSVADTGMGMKKEDMDRIFERFYRADDVRNNKINGHGLGLSIAKLIVLKHTGTIQVKSQYTKGSSFTIRIPDYYSKGCLK